MSTNRQRLRVVIKRLKTDIKKAFQGLLLTAVILFGAVLSLVNPIKGAEQFLFHHFNNFIEKSESITVEHTQEELNKPQENTTISTTYLSANSLSSLTNQINTPNLPEQSYVDEESSLATIQSKAILSQASPLTVISQDARDGTITCTVQEGDTPSSIAASYGITVNTLLWANKLSATSIIRPGDELIILPVSGVIHKVQQDHTISWIAKYYQAEEEDIIAFNDLPADGSIQVGEKIIIPDGQMPAPARPKTTTSQSYTSVTGPGTGKSRVFPQGQCTWYVAQKRYVPWSGHAKSWLVNARAYGFSTGSIPQAGAIMVLTEGGWVGRYYGHVAYVESVQGNWVTISEMNYTCWGCKSVRTLRITDGRIRGYIY